MNVLNKRFINIAIASIVTQIVTYLLVLIDNIVAGHMIGEQAIAAITVMAPLLSILVFIAYILTLGTGMLISYALGEGNKEEANRLYSQGLIVSLVTSVLLTLGLIIFKNNILSMFELSDDIRNYAELYYNALMFAPISFFINTYLYTVLPIVGLEGATTKASILECLVNIVFSIILCALFGMIGIGASTVLGNIVGTIIMLVYMKRENFSLQYKWYFNFKKYIKSFSYSILNSIDTFCMSLLPLFITMIIVNDFGDEHLLTFALELNMINLVVNIFVGLADSIQPIICGLHAEKSDLDIKMLSKVFITTAIVLSVICSLLMYIFAPVLPNIFGIENTEAIEDGIKAIHILAPSIPFFSIMLIICNYFIFTEKKVYGVTMQFLVMLIMPAIIAKILSINGNIDGIWIGLSLGFSIVLFINLLITKIYSLLKKRKYTSVLLLDKERMQRQMVYNIKNDTHSIIETSKKVIEDLEKLGISNEKCNLAAVMVEETSMRIVESDGEDKRMIEYIITAEKDNSIIFIMRDDGKSRDVLADDIPISIREFFISQISEYVPKKTYIPNGDENRLMFKF